MTAPRRRPRPRLKCPVCGGAPRLPVDLRAPLRCQCGAALRLRLVTDGPPPAPDFEAGDRRLPDAPDDNIGRPRPIFRGTGADRERQWGAVVDLPAAPGDRVQVFAKSGRTWTATVAEPLGAVNGGGHLVSLRGAEWQPAPDTPPADPDWLAD